MQPFTFFISYRRQDTAPIALLLKSEIEKRLEFVRLSVDVEEMSPGDHFPDRLEALIRDSHATIVLIGENWMPRHGDPSRIGDDWVIRELEYSRNEPLMPIVSDRFGLEQRAIIPIFVDCRQGFSQFELPSALQFLTSLQSECEYIDHAGWPRSIAPLLEKIADKFGIKKRLGQDEFPPADPAKARTQPLADEELSKILAYDAYEGWYVDNFGHLNVRYLVKMFEFRDFNQAADFMKMVADHCRVLGHHPEWRNVFRHVTVSLTTWDARRKVTIYDLNLALYMNKAAKTVSG